jgi:hypothetical protein
MFSTFSLSGVRVAGDVVAGGLAFVGVAVVLEHDAATNVSSITRLNNRVDILYRGFIN